LTWSVRHSPAQPRGNADDSTLIAKGKNMKENIEICQRKLVELKEKFVSHGLLLNTKKTCVMKFLSKSEVPKGGRDGL